MNNKALLDTRYNIETPEGIEITIVPAGICVRLYAYLIDSLIKVAILLAAAWLVTLFYTLGEALYLLIFFIVEWLYPVFFEVFRHGITPGKKVYNLKVIQENGTPLTLGSSFIRNLLRPIDMLPIGYVFGMLSIFMTKKMQRLGDIAASTVVVYQQDKERKSSIPSASQIMPHFKLSQDEQAAVLLFAERVEKLSESRAAEIANILSALTKHKDKDNVQYLIQIANGIIGEGKS